MTVYRVQLGTYATVEQVIFIDRRAAEKFADKCAKEPHQSIPHASRYRDVFLVKQETGEASSEILQSWENQI